MLANRASLLLAPLLALILVPSARPDSREPAVNVAASRTLHGVVRARLGARAYTASTVVFTPDGRSLVTAGNHHDLTVWDMKTGKASWELPVVKKEDAYHSFQAWAISPDGKTLVSSDPFGWLLWDWPTRKVRRKTPSSSIQRAVFAADGKALFLLSGKVVIRHDSATGAREAESAPVAEGVLNGGLAVTPDGKTVAVGGKEGFVVLLDGKTLKENKRLPGHGRLINALAMSPDGKTLASAAFDDKQVKLYDLEKQAEVRSIPREGELVTAMAFSPSGKLLAAGGSAVTLYDAASGKELSQLSGSLGSVNDLAFSPDG